MGRADDGDGGSAPERARRRYRTPARAAQARETRRRVLDAAAELFATQGFAGTSLARIGRHAGVSTESVAAQGPKGALLIAAFELVIGGREGSDAISARPDVQALFAVGDRAQMLAGLAELAVTSQARSIGLWRALSAAAAENAEVAELYADLSRRRLADNRVAVDTLAARGFLRTDRPPEELAETLALLSGPEPYQLFVREFGWSEDRMRAWWVDTVTQLLLRPA